MPGIAKHGINLTSPASLFSPARAGDSVQGLAFDGTHYYVSYSGGSNRISKYDTSFAEVLTNANASTLLNNVSINSLGDVCVYGGFLWAATGAEGTKTYIFKLDPSNLTYVAHFDITSTFGTDSANGIARYGNNWYVASAYLNLTTFHVDIYNDDFSVRVGSAYVSKGVHENGCQSLAVWGRYMLGGMHRGTARVWYIKDDGTLEIVQEFDGFSYTHSGTANTQGIDVLGDTLYVLDRVGTGTGTGQVHSGTLSEKTSGIWLPTRLDPLDWYDPSDSSQLVLSGNAVGGWRSRGWFTGDLAQATAGNKPTRVAAGQNGRDYVSYDGTDDFMSNVGAIALRRVSGFTFAFAFAAIGAAPASNRSLYFVTTGAGNARASLYIEASTKKLALGGRMTDGEAFDGCVEASALDSAWHVVVGVADYQNRVVTLYRDGVQTAQKTSWLTSSGQTPSTGGDIYCGQASGFPYAAYRGEIITFSHAVNQTDRELIEGYLASNWGTQNLLQSNHPYKNAGPTLDPISLGIKTPAFGLGAGRSFLSLGTRGPR